MLRREFTWLMVRRSGIGLAATWLTGCGTLMHPERQGGPHSNQIDWRIAALNGLGLLLFFVPGVIAFVVDFYTGAIYLPLEPGGGATREIPSYPHGFAPNEPPPQYQAIPELIPPAAPSAGKTTVLEGQPLGLKRVLIGREQLWPNRIEQVVTEHVGYDVALNDGRARLSPLSQIDQFPEQLARHRADGNFGDDVRAFFRRWQRA